MTGQRIPVRLWRSAYKAAWLVRKGLWYAPWPHLNGALVAVWAGDRVLLVRNSYNDYFTLPGGRLNGGETYRDAAARELLEETGIAVKPAALTPALSEDRLRPLGSARVDIFQIRMQMAPTVRPDPVEIADYRWCTSEEAGQLSLFRPVRRYLRELRQS